MQLKHCSNHLYLSRTAKKANNTSFYSILAILVLITLSTPLNTQANRFPLEEQRKLFEKTEKAIKNGRFALYKSDKERLEALNYPLAPYLEYADISRQLHKLPRRRVIAFIKKNNQQLLANRLHYRWLSTLAAQKKWKIFLEDYSKDINSQDLKCHYHWAQYQEGNKKAALVAAKKLWLVGKSQSKACNPLFKAWKAKNQLTPDIAWQRFNLAMNNNEISLAKYLTRYLATRKKKLADIYLRVHSQPHLINQFRSLRSPSTEHKNIIFHALKRLGYRDTDVAVKSWKTFKKLQSFSTSEQQTINKMLALAQATDFTDNAEHALTQADPELQDEALTDWRLRVALRKKNWLHIYRLFNQLPIERQNDSMWLYWYARAGEQIKRHHGYPVDYEAIYTSVAQKRNFYGFSAAEWLQQNYPLEHKPLNISPQTKNKVIQTPGIQRALEFYALKRLNDARREWQFAIKSFDKTELYTAAQIAHKLGWHNRAITSLISAKFWDDVELRFPMAFKKDILSNAKKNNIDSSWVFAIARQESAFMPDAKSPVGALGLMQLMPRTAKAVARKVGIKYKRSHAILNPSTNITLGSAYLKQMLERYTGQHAFATAAYNAGPLKVDKWIQATRDMPVDIWIETIPYHETRDYVKNVLTYAVIYGQHLGENRSMLVEPQIPLATMSNEISKKTRHRLVN